MGDVAEFEGIGVVERVAEGGAATGDDGGGEGSSGLVPAGEIVGDGREEMGRCAVVEAGERHFSVRRAGCKTGEGVDVGEGIRDGGVGDSAVEKQGGLGGGEGVEVGVLRGGDGREISLLGFGGGEEEEASGDGAAKGAAVVLAGVVGLDEGAGDEPGGVVGGDGVRVGGGEGAGAIGEEG